MKRKFLQSIVDSIIKKMENATHDEIFDFYLELGLWFDSFCINNMNIYLD